MKELEEYLEKILIYGLKIEPNDNLIIIINEDQPELYEIMENLRAKFHLRDIIYKVENLKDIYTTLSQNQKISLPEYRVPNNKNKVKVLQFLDDSFSDYMQKLYYESDRICDEYISYINAKKAKNKKFYDLLEKSRTLLSVYPSTNWANQIYGYNAQEKLLADIIKMVPENIREEIEKLQYIKDYLNSLKIKNLALYSDTETELEIGLNEYARWTVAEINFPSYEIYTSPDIRYAKGILCLEKPSILYGEVVTKAMLTFDKGKLTKVSSDNHDWEKMILNNENQMRTIGEIGLVSIDNPIARLNKIYNNILLDENSATHIALGDSLKECIAVSDECLKEESKKHFNFSASEYHQDLIFGNNSLEVRCQTQNGQTKTLIKKGIWNI